MDRRRELTRGTQDRSRRLTNLAGDWNVQRAFQHRWWLEPDPYRALHDYALQLSVIPANGVYHVQIAIRTKQGVILHNDLSFIQWVSLLKSLHRAGNHNYVIHFV
jgi:hypothetical protein